MHENNTADFSFSVLECRVKTETPPICNALCASKGPGNKPGENFLSSMAATRRLGKVKEAI